MGLIEESVRQDGRIVAGGMSQRLMIEPTVLRDMKNEYAAVRNQVFGPVAPIIPFDTDQEGVALANGTPYGLSGSVHSRDIRRAYRVDFAVETGMIHINDQGVHEKASGMGRYNSDTIIDEMTDLKWISFQIGLRQYPF